MNCNIWVVGKIKTSCHAKQYNIVILFFYINNKIVLQLNMYIYNKQYL